MSRGSASEGRFTGGSCSISPVATLAMPPMTSSNFRVAALVRRSPCASCCGASIEISSMNWMTFPVHRRRSLSRAGFLRLRLPAQRSPSSFHQLCTVSPLNSLAAVLEGAHLTTTSSPTKYSIKASATLIIEVLPVPAGPMIASIICPNLRRCFFPQSVSALRRPSAIHFRLIRICNHAAMCSKARACLTLIRPV